MKLLTALLLLAVAAPTPEMRYFKYERAVQLPQDAAGQTCFAIDPQTFNHAASDLADLRLYRDSVESPFVIEQATASETPERTLTPVNLGERNGHTVFDVGMPDAAYSDIQLTLYAQNFIATVTVLGSQNMGEKPTKIGAYTVFDLSSQKLGRSTVVHLPDSNFRYLHFETDGQLSPSQIGSVSVASQPISKPHYLAVLNAARFQVQGRDSVTEFTTPARVPIDRIVFSPADNLVNFSREVEVKVTAITPEPDRSNTPTFATSNGSLRSIHRSQNGHRIDDTQLSLDAPRIPFDLPAKWTITIHNGDDAPITFANVRLEMLQRDLCFDATQGARYTLFYGDDALSAPRYDYAALFSSQVKPAAAVLGPEQPNPSYQSRPDQRPFTEKHPLLLWVALVLVVLLLGVIALRSAKRVQPPVPMP